MRPWLRTSAWLPPGLALAWLAVLATFVHGVGNLLAAWAATVPLIVLLARWRPTARRNNPAENAGGSALPQTPGSSAPGSTPPLAHDTTPGPSRGEEGTGGGAAHPTSAVEDAATSVSPSNESSSGSGSEAEPSQSNSTSEAAAPGTSAFLTAGQTGQAGGTDIAVTLGLRILTVAEVASVLRVGADEIVTAISNGELPGNRIGSHWRVDQGALARWLQGAYGDLAERAGPPSVPISRGPTRPGLDSPA
jgi:excisionase family DNA binding protein